MTIVLGVILYVILLGITVLFGRFMKECDISMMNSEESGFHQHMSKPLSHRRLVHRRIR
ncbi:MAG: hypothetical protein KA247_10075 [Bacteroidetes bacterium]|nr:hypothetical protein [Bacteroidota bacterium]